MHSGIQRYREAIGGAVGFRLAEVGEGESEDWGGSGVKLHYLDGVVDSESETTDRRGRGWRR